MIKKTDRNFMFWFYSCLKMLFFSFYGFFTHWVLTLLILYYLGPLRKYQTSIMYLLILTSLGGLYLTYINPKKFIVPYWKYEIKGNLLRIIDLLFHHIPLLIFLVTYDNTIKKDNGIFLLVIISIYLIVLNPFKAYHLKF